MNCISCQSKGDILVKSVMFCNTCFTSKLIRKIRQTINTIKSNKIIIDCSTQKNYRPYITLILDACHYRHNKEIMLMNNNDTEVTKTISIEEFDMLNKDECALIKLYNIDDLAVRIFESIIKGQPQETVDLVCSSNIFYPFEKVSTMEIEHYCKINGIEMQNDENDSLTKQFLRNANDTNYSASFNIVETIRKGAMDRNNNK